jgi:hypothetical protein
MTMSSGMPRPNIKSLHSVKKPKCAAHEERG